jgi:DNA-binding XRE family transcriptional regulator
MKVHPGCVAVHGDLPLTNYLALYRRRREHDAHDVVSIAQLREARGLSQRDLAALVGVSHAQIGMVETGRRRLNPDARIRLIRVLDLGSNEVQQIAELSPVAAKSRMTMGHESALTHDQP